MAIILYYVKMSPPVRAVMLTAKAIGVELTLRLVDLSNGEQMKPEFLKLNPMHTVPTLDDNGFVIFDSHAICGYLVNKYGKTDALYPKEAAARAIVDQRLHFDSGILFPRLRNMVYPILRLGETSISEERKKAVYESYDFFGKLLGDNPWIAGKQMSIADLCCVTTISSAQLLVPGIEKHPNIVTWYDRCKKQILGYEEINQDGLNQFEAIVKSKLA